MNKVKLYSNNGLRLSLLGAFVLAATACSHSGGSATNGGDNSANGDASTLQVITPKTIYSKPDTVGSAYVVINNSTNAAVKNLHYSLTNPIGSASKAAIDPVSAANCSTVAAYSQCNVKVTVAAGAVAGSIGFSLSNNSTLLNKLAKSAQAVALASTMGIEQAAYNSLKGADGITLSYYNTVINGTPYILVSGLVASNNAGSFDKVVLVNGSGVAIPNQQLISSVSSAQGSTFNILLPVPSANNATQTIKAQTQQNNTVVSTATASSTLSTQQNIGIANLLPSAVYLTSANPEQIITFANTGDAVAQLQQLVSNNPNVEVTFSPSSLTSGATTTATLKLKNTAVAGTSGSVTLTYNNGQSQTSTSGSVEQNVDPAPSPTPTPTPTPTPGPPPGPSAGLTAVLSSMNFYTTTAVGSVSNQMTISNTGNTVEDNIILALPANFSISSGTNNSCTVTRGVDPATISDSLAGAGSCDVTVTYANSSVTSGSGNISITYNYNNGTPAPTPATAPVNYGVTQSTANLSLTPNTTQTYPSIVSNNTAVSTPISYTLTNSGDATASALIFNFTGTNPSFFSSIAGGTCISGGTLASTLGSNSCTINTQFGPAPNNSAGIKTAEFYVGYTPYTAATPTNTTSVNLSGRVTAAPSATFTDNLSANTFTGGNGSSGTPYTGYTNTAYTLSVTYTNGSLIPATGFTTSSPTLPTGWSRTTYGCNNVAMAATSGSCTDVYTLNSATAGSADINLSNVTTSWSDSSGSYTAQSVSGVSTVYATLVPPPAVTIAPVANWSTMMGSAYIFTATITNGSSTVTPTVTGLTGNTVSPASCTLDSAVSGSESCTFMVTSYTGSGNYAYWNPSSINNSTDVANPASAYTQSGISLQVATTNSINVNGHASPYTFTNIAGTVLAPYVYLPAPMVGATTESNNGITWGTGGTVSNRFAVGKTSSNGNCTGGEEIESDTLTGLTWVKTPTSTTYDWANAKIAPAIPASYCGYSDWRLPTINELKSLVNYAATQHNSTPAAWLNSHGFTDVQDTNYWSSTAYDGSNSWYVYFGDGFSLYDGVSNTYSVWPVRGGQ